MDEEEESEESDAPTGKKSWAERRAEKKQVQEIPIIKTVKQEEPKQEGQKPKKMGRPSYEDLGMGDKRRINKSITFDEEIYNRAYQAGKKRRISVSLFIEDAIVKYLDELGE